MTIRRWIGPGLGVVALLVFLLLPPLEPLTSLGMKVVGVFLFTIIWWVTVGTGYPSILCLVLLALTGVMTPKVLFAVSWGHWLILFLLGIYGLSEGLRVTGFSRRFALWFVTRPFVTGRPWMLVAMFLLACFLMGSVMTSVATCVVFMAIAEPLLEAAGYKKGDRFASMLMMGIAWAATASSIVTPIAHPCILLAIDFIQRDFGYSISFLQWMTFGIPMGLMTFFGFLGVFRYVVRPDVSKISDMATTEYLRSESSKMGAMKLEEKLAIGILLMVIVCWVLPGIPGNILPGISAYLSKMGYAVPALIGPCLLCLIRVKNKPLMTFRQWMMDGVGWGTVALCGAIFAIGSVIGKPETGIPQLLTGIFQPIATAVPFYVFVLISILWVTIQTNIMSNLVSTSLVYTVMVPVAAAIGGGNPIALGALIGGASYYAFSLPSATAVTAVVIGSGWVPVGLMARYGFLFIIPVALLFTFIAYPIASFVLH